METVWNRHGQQFIYFIPLIVSEANMNLNEIATNPELLEVARLAIEDTLVDLRDSRISTFRNNGLVIKEYDGADSDIIRMGPEDAIRIGLKAIAKHLCERSEHC